MNTILQEQVKPRILIIDNESIIREGTKLLLENEGYDVDVSENGILGIQAGLKNNYDLILIDLDLPDINGLEVLKTIKIDCPSTICFISTSNGTYDTAIEATKLGAFNCINKPFAADDLFYQLGLGYKQRLIFVQAENLREHRENSLAEIAHEKNILKTIIESISSGVVLVDMSGGVVYFNKATLQKLNLSELRIGDYLLDKLPAALTEIVNEYLGKSEFTNYSKTIQLEIVKGEMIVDATCNPVSNQDGSVAGIVIVLKNITEFKRIEHIKNEFISMVAHELKTPITAVAGFLQLLQDETIELDKEKKIDFLSRSEIRLKGTMKLINDLLNISRMELKTRERVIDKIDVLSILNSTLEFLELEIKNKNISITINSEEEILVTADSSEVNQIFTNLLTNAIKYNKINGSITIDLEKSNNYLEIKISDTGIGLRENEKEKLFAEFFRAKNKYTKGITGTGLGLNIVKRIVDNNHGTITVESVYEEGSTFIIKLPVTN